ncbi:unnamed protein product [Ectocarpus fasciculatus]
MHLFPGPSVSIHSSDGSQGVTSARQVPPQWIASLSIVVAHRPIMYLSDDVAVVLSNPADNGDHRAHATMSVGHSLGGTDKGSPASEGSRSSSQSCRAGLGRERDG